MTNEYIAREVLEIVVAKQITESSPWIESAEVSLEDRGIGGTVRVQFYGNPSVNDAVRELQIPDFFDIGEDVTVRGGTLTAGIAFFAPWDLAGISEVEGGGHRVQG